MASIELQNNVLKLSGDMLIESMSDLLKQVNALNLVESSFDSPLVLDFSQVKEIDTSALSFVLEMHRKRQATMPAQATKPKKLTKPLKLISVPTNLRSLMKLYGVDKFLLN